MLPYRFIITDVAYDALLRLTPKERKIIRAFLKHLTQFPNQKPDFQYSVAGKTVNKKLLGRLRVHYAVVDIVSEVQLLDIN